MDDIDLDDEVFEGRLFGWRWISVIHGPWLPVSPVIHTPSTYGPTEVERPTPGDESEWMRAMNEYLNVVDLHDWNEADQAPRILSPSKRRPEINVSDVHGFHIFRTHELAISKYASQVIGICRLGYQLPWKNNDEVPRSWEPWLADWPNQTYLSATPLLAFVELGGIVVEHDDGYRAQKVRVLKLYSPRGPKTRRLLTDKIGWPGKIERVRKFLPRRSPVKDNLRRLEA